MQTTDSKPLMFGVHRGEEVGCDLVLRLPLPAAPVQEQTVPEAPQNAHDPHGFGQAHAALVVQMADVQPQMQAVLDAPGGAVVCQPLGGGNFRLTTSQLLRDAK